ncbi:uncharacterized protein LOC8036853 isoform X2 [Ixodes scapularis]|uniref:uncharacterized protein LOC8036853 isoform X2 n=1 Tax=Ixodes scapularis TaxID=6945 RepID=UPI001C38867F|nr:uncharacterized protein LOC8036853 isoform X2 [Ixodes scapularis]
MTGCCAFGCKRRHSDGTKLFSIPSGKRDAARRKVWLHRIGRANFEPTPSTRLCEEHFTEDQFEPLVLQNHGIRKLKPDATPSIFVHRKHRVKRTSSACSAAPAADQDTTATSNTVPTTHADHDARLPQLSVQGPQTPSAFGDPQPLPAAAADVVDRTTSACSASSAPHQDESGGVNGSSSSTRPVSEIAVAALHKRIEELEEQLRSTKRRLSLSQRQRNKAVEEKNSLGKQLHRFLAPDQLQCMGSSTMKGTPWSTATIEKALKLRLACGARGFNVVRELAAPLPTERTLQRYLEKFKFSPGNLHNVLQSLAVKVNFMEDHERHAVLMLGEIQLTTGLACEQETGISTPPSVDGTRPEDVTVTHGHVFMLGGVTTHWRQTVAYHVTENSFGSDAVKSVTLAILQECEQFGIRVDDVVSDIGNKN